MNLHQNELSIQTLLAAPAAKRAGMLGGGADADAATARLVEEAEHLAQSAAGRGAPGVAAVADVAEDRANATRAADAYALASRAKRALSHALATSGVFAESLEAARRARSLALAAGDQSLEARALLAHMQPLLKTGSSAEAIEMGEASIEIFTATGDHSLAARARVNVANVLKALGRGADAVKLIDAALDACGDQPAFVIVAQNTRAEALLQLGEFELARRAFHLALSHTDPDIESFPSAMVKSNVADLDARLGRSQAALDGYEVARRAFGAIHAQAQVARVSVEEAELLATLGAIGEAAEAFRAVLPQLDAAGLVFERARAMDGIAMIATRDATTHHAEALQACERAVEAWRGSGNDYQCARSRLRLAELAVKAGELERADGQIATASKTLTGSTVDGLALAAARAAVAQARGSHAESLRLLADGELAAASLHLAPAASALAARAANLERLAGNVDRAIDAARRAVAHVERARASVNAERLRQSLLGSHVDAYEELVLGLLARNAPGDTERALDVVGRAKSRSLIERVMAGMREEPAPGAQASQTEDTARRRVLEERLNALYKSMSSSEGTAGERDVRAHTVSREISAVERELDILMVRDKAPDLLLELPAWTESRRFLAPGDVLLEYFVAGSQVRVFVGNHDGPVQVRDVGMSVEELSLHIRRVQFQVRRSLRGSSDAADQLDAHMQDLGKAMLGPVEDAIRSAKRLLVAPHLVLHGIPMAALRLSDGQALLDLAPVAVVPSGSMVPALWSGGTRSAVPNALVVGVADAQAPEIEPEALEVAAALGTTPLLGSEATVERVVEALESADVAHLACHGLYLPDAARSSGLKLADGWLTVRKIHALRRGPGTVILSACETGKSRWSPGDEHLGLVRAFVDRGARTVIATLWPAQDAATRAMMVEFHRSRAIPSTGTDAAGLRTAQLALRAREPDPARWAPFFVTGGLS
ncbi:MAG: CHAT domain-containing protein [Planctomycetota bacterium]|nr:CHAT domain-containing protein [Planctomycetota bacterium]MDA1105198.1 CHAT domain-containing protein [Planctomycetota bacterium]